MTVPRDTNESANDRTSGDPATLHGADSHSTPGHESHRATRGGQRSANPVVRFVRWAGNVGAMLVGLVAAFVVAVTTMRTGSAEVRVRARREAANLGTVLAGMIILAGTVWFVVERLARWLLAP